MGSDAHTRFTADELRKITNLEVKNFTHDNSTLFLVWDAGIDLLIGHFAADFDYAYIRKMPSPQRELEVAVVHEAANAVKDDIVCNLKDDPGKLPTKTDFIVANTRMYHLFNPQHEIGKFYRGIIEQVFKELGLPPIKDLGNFRSGVAEVEPQQRAPR